jgi:S-adenosylmethionine synthetase
MTELVIRAQDRSLPCEEPLEVLERKGLGHPDSICDAILVSRIGAPVDEPQVIDVRIASEFADVSSLLRTDVGSAVREQLSMLGSMREDILAGRATVY